MCANQIIYSYCRVQWHIHPISSLILYYFGQICFNLCFGFHWQSFHVNNLDYDLLAYFPDMKHRFFLRPWQYSQATARPTSQTNKKRLSRPSEMKPRSGNLLLAFLTSEKSKCAVTPDVHTKPPCWWDTLTALICWRLRKVFGPFNIAVDFLHVYVLVCFPHVFLLSSLRKRKTEEASKVAPPSSTHVFKINSA